MKLLLISNLNGNRRPYEFLVAQAEQFDAMLWVGNLTNLHSGDLVTQQALVEESCGAIQAKGCRVLACGGEQDRWIGPWRWLQQQGTFVTSGLFVTTMPEQEARLHQLEMLREVVRSADSLWIALSRAPIVSASLKTGTPESPHSASRPGPDIIVASPGDHPVHRNTTWCRRNGHTWVLIPDRDDQGEFPAHIVLDTARYTAERHTSTGREQRDLRIPPKECASANAEQTFIHRISKPLSEESKHEESRYHNHRNGLRKTAVHRRSRGTLRPLRRITPGAEM